MRSLALEIDNISYQRGKKQILNDISFAIDSNECVAIIGENGAGKSTLFDIILTDLNPSSGKILYFEKKNYPTDKIGFCYDNFNIFPELKIREIIKFFCKEYGLEYTEVERYFDLFHLHQLLDSFLCELSMGEKKRLSILLSIVHNPELLILDEPFSNIDPILVDSLWNVIRKKVKSILYSTHNWNSAIDLADRLIFIKNGKIVGESASPSTILSILPSGNKIVIHGWNNQLEMIKNELSYYLEGESVHIFVTNYVRELIDKDYFDSYSFTKVGIQDVYFYTYKNS